MTQCKFYSFADGAVVDRDIDATSFGTRSPRRVQREAVLMYQANLRAGTHDTLNRADVTATKHKPWKQKGTGRARSGRKSSPIWRGGGVAHGPHPRDYSYGVPRKALRAATRAAVCGKFLDNEVAAIDTLTFEEPSTKKMAAVLAALGVQGSFLIVVPEYDEMAWKSVRNISGGRMMTAADVNAYEVLKHRTLILVGDALERVAERVGPAAPADVAEAN